VKVDLILIVKLLM